MGKNYPKEKDKFIMETKYASNLFNGPKSPLDKSIGLMTTMEHQLCGHNDTESTT